MPDRSLKVIYILGTGRCGSTLLSCVLGQAEGVVAPGEIGLVWQRIATGKHLCDCGAAFRQCEFWRQAVSETPFALEPATVRYLNEMHWKLTGLRGVPRLLLCRSHNGLFDTKRRQYLQCLLPVYEAISRLSRCEVVIDASKRPLHALLLSRIPSIETHYIHLVRDSRAVVHSQRRRTRRSASYLAARWVTVNLLCEAVARRQGNHLFVRYEDFCLRPQSHLSAIASFTGDIFEPIHMMPNGYVELRPAHGLGGDDVRLQTGVVRISANEEWRRKIESADRRIVTAMSWPLLARYGYKI